MVNLIESIRVGYCWLTERYCGVDYCSPIVRSGLRKFSVDKKFKFANKSPNTLILKTVFRNNRKEKPSLCYMVDTTVLLHCMSKYRYVRNEIT